MSTEEQFDFYWKEIFDGLPYNPIEFNVYRFDQSMSLPSKFNKLYEMFKQLALNNQEVMDYLKEFMETFDFKLETTIKDILIVWLNEGLLADVVREAINEEVVEARTDYLGHTYLNLKERLDVENTDITTQLAQTTLNGRTLKFETIEDMVNKSSRIKNGDFVEVMGYYTTGDGGGHTRLISNVSNLLSIDLGNGLYANVTGSQDDLRVFGIVFGLDSDGVFNSEMLKKVLSFYNGFTQKSSLKNEIINVSYFYHTIKNNNFNYQNINLRVVELYTGKNYIIGIESPLTYITMRDFTISQGDLQQNRDNIKKQYAVKLADNNNSSWGGARYNIERATITGFSVPLFVNTWNSSIKDINFAYTDTGVVAFGTSTEMSSIYVNRSLYGNVLGAVYNIASESFSISTHSVFFYSTLGSLANDHVERNILVCGKTSGVLITSIGYEFAGANADSVVLAIDKNTRRRLSIANGLFADSGNGKPGYLLSSQDPSVGFELFIENMTNESISKMKNNPQLSVEISNHLSHISRLNFNGVYNNKLVMNNSEPTSMGRYKNLNFVGKAKTFVGSSDVMMTGNFYEIETFFTKKQALKIPITPLIWSVTASQRTGFKIRVELSISDVDINSSRSINNQYFITSFNVGYTKGETLITPSIKRLDDSVTDNLIVEVDNTGDYPYLVIKTPDATGPASYYISGKVVSGGRQADVIIQDY